MWVKQFPLSTRGRHIVNCSGERFKFAGINWYGASDAFHVVGGLADRSLAGICGAVASMGFTVVRLPFSNEMLRANAQVAKGAIDFTLNPTLRDLTPVQVLDRVVDTLGEYHVAVVLNNHTTLGMWSGGVESNGMWFLDEDEDPSARQNEQVPLGENEASRARRRTARGETKAGQHSEDQVSRTLPPGRARAPAQLGEDANIARPGQGGGRDCGTLQGRRYSEDAWVEDWVFLASRYRDKPWVVGYDLRNEVRPQKILQPSKWPHWSVSPPRPARIATAASSASPRGGATPARRGSWTSARVFPAPSFEALSAVGSSSGGQPGGGGGAGAEEEDERSTGQQRRGRGGGGVSPESGRTTDPVVVVEDTQSSPPASPSSPFSSLFSSAAVAPAPPPSRSLDSSNSQQQQQQQQQSLPGPPHPPLAARSNWWRGTTPKLDGGGGGGAVGEEVNWRRASGRCGRALVASGAPGLIVVERMAWPQSGLDSMLSSSDLLPWDTSPHLSPSPFPPPTSSSSSSTAPPLSSTPSSSSRPSSSSSWSPLRSREARQRRRRHQQACARAAMEALGEDTEALPPLLLNQHTGRRRRSSGGGARKTSSEGSAARGASPCLSSPPSSPCTTSTPSSSSSSPSSSASSTPQSSHSFSFDDESISCSMNRSTSSTGSTTSAATTSGTTTTSGSSSSHRSLHNQRRYLDPPPIDHLASPPQAAPVAAPVNHPAPRHSSRNRRNRREQRLQATEGGAAAAAHDQGAFAGVPRDRVVLAVHAYAWSGPGYWSPKQFTSGVLRMALRLRDWASGLMLYGEMGSDFDEATAESAALSPQPAAQQQTVKPSLEAQLQKEWGWVLDQNVCPVWLSEFGGDLNNPDDMNWFRRTCSWLEKKDADFAYWPLNVGPKAGHSQAGDMGRGNESYGLLTNDWRPRWHDERLRVLRRLMIPSHATLDLAAEAAQQRREQRARSGSRSTIRRRRRSRSSSGSGTPSTSTSHSPDTGSAAEGKGGVVIVGSSTSSAGSSADSSRDNAGACGGWCSGSEAARINVVAETAEGEPTQRQSGGDNDARESLDRVPHARGTDPFISTETSEMSGTSCRSRTSSRSGSAEGAGKHLASEDALLEAEEREGDHQEAEAAPGAGAPSSSASSSASERFSRSEADPSDAGWLLGGLGAAAALAGKEGIEMGPPPLFPVRFPLVMAPPPPLPAIAAAAAAAAAPPLGAPSDAAQTRAETSDGAPDAADPTTGAPGGGGRTLPVDWWGSPLPGPLVEWPERDEEEEEEEEEGEGREDAANTPREEVATEIGEGDEESPLTPRPPNGGVVTSSPPPEGATVERLSHGQQQQQQQQQRQQQQYDEVALPVGGDTPAAPAPSSANHEGVAAASPTSPSVEQPQQKQKQEQQQQQPPSLPRRRDSSAALLAATTSPPRRRSSFATFREDASSGLRKWGGLQPLPEALYSWTVLPGCDADPGLDAAEVDLSMLAHHHLETHIEVLKQSCVLGGFGGFALREGKAYFRNADASSLRRRVEGEHTGTALFIPQEVRLCRRIISTPRPSTSTPPPPTTTTTTAGATAGDGSGEGRLLPSSSSSQEAEALAEQPPLQPLASPATLAPAFGFGGQDGGQDEEANVGRGWGPPASRNGRRHSSGGTSSTSNSNSSSSSSLSWEDEEGELVPVCVGLEEFRARDSFPGADAKVVQSIGYERCNLSFCRERCLAEGYGGFAVDSRTGTAYFRSAKPWVLRGRLEDAPAHMTFFVLTVTEFQAPPPHPLARAPPSPPDAPPSSPGGSGGGGGGGGPPLGAKRERQDQQLASSISSAAAAVPGSGGRPLGTLFSTPPPSPSSPPESPHDQTPFFPPSPSRSGGGGRDLQRELPERAAQQIAQQQQQQQQQQRFHSPPPVSLWRCPPLEWAEDYF